MFKYKTWESGCKMQFSFHNPDAQEGISPWTFSSDRGRMAVVQTQPGNDLPEFIMGRLDIAPLGQALIIGEYEVPTCEILRLETISDTTGALISKMLRPVAP